jgi:hypothetical protein
VGEIEQTSLGTKKVRRLRRCGEPACKPCSVLNSHSSGTCVAARLKRPTRKHARAALRPFDGPRLPYLALHQVGFAMPSRVTTDAVRSYRTVSPLPAPLPALRRFTLCCTFRGLAPPRYYLAPCPLKPGLSSTPHRMPRSDCPADSPPRHLTVSACEAPVHTRRCVYSPPAARRWPPHGPAATPPAATAVRASATAGRRR